LSAAAPPTDPQVEEVRVAMALNGGVSLAVWMGGCAVELDSARRAHLEPDPDQAVAGGTQPTIYGALCKALRRELVLDIFAGASAGGINGALLAAAVRRSRRLTPDFLRSRWLRLGDLSSLMEPRSTVAPRALLQGGLFYDSILEAFRAILGEPAAGAAALAETSLPADHGKLHPRDAQLDVTATNVLGRLRRFRDSWGQDLYARDYRSRFRFRLESDFTGVKLGTAARATASFPIAFPPFRIDDFDASGVQRPSEELVQELGGADAPWYAIDGGLLDNAPIRAALELIPTRPARTRVKRLVCYVNADPPSGIVVPAPDEPGPTLQQVVGYVINLPRNAVFVDQVNAIETAVRSSSFRDSQATLLALDLPSLTATATALLPAYVARRRASSLEDLLAENADVDLALARLEETGLELPWLPADLELPPADEVWRWGVLPAERILHLLLDVLREPIRAAPPDTLERLLVARRAIDMCLQKIEVMRDNALGPGLQGALAELIVPGGDAAAAVRSAAIYALPASKQAFEWVEFGFAAVYDVRDLLDPAARHALFGDTNDQEPAFANLLRRGLAIEVVRRAFRDIDQFDSGQKLSFVQLTPAAPTPVLSARPLTEPGPDTVTGKLTGIKLGHFGGFYRRSWRANDFMWGRLDAASRIADMLVDTERANRVVADGMGTPWSDLASALLAPSGVDPTAARQLAHELLLDAATLPDSLRKFPATLREGYMAALESYPMSPPDEPPAAAVLLPFLTAALAADLQHPQGGILTSRACARIAQCAILAEELPIVVEQSRRDAADGSYAKALPAELASGSFNAVLRLRTDLGAAEPKPLPALLERDDEREIASSLALRTVTSALLVGLGTMRAAKLPFASLLAFFRPTLLQIGGAVSGDWRLRCAAVFAYLAAACYLTARIVSMNGATDELDGAAIGEVPLGSLWSLSTLVALVSLFVVVGASFVPLLRFLRIKTELRGVGNLAAAVTLVVAGGAGAAALAKWRGGFGFADLIGAPEADLPPDTLLVAVLIVAGLLPATRLRFLRVAVRRLGWLQQALESPWSGWGALLLILTVLGATLLWTVPTLVDGLGAGGWRTLAALLPPAGALVYFVYLLWRIARAKAMSLASSSAS
jgi:predicted acylesterase/phospholipase RssA